MTDNLKEKTNKAVDNSRMAAGTVHDDAKVSTSNVHNDACMKSLKVSRSSADTTRTKSIKEQIHAHISECLVRAKFPIKTVAVLIAAFPNGAATSCQVGDLKMTAGDAGKLLKASDFPFKSANAVADVIVSRASL
jgi:hypothetical protein